MWLWGRGSAVCAQDRSHVCVEQEVLAYADAMRYCFQRELRNSTSRPRDDILYPFDFFTTGCEVHAQDSILLRTGWWGNRLVRGRQKVQVRHIQCGPRFGERSSNCWRTQHSERKDSFHKPTLLVGAQKRLFEFLELCISFVAPCFESSHISIKMRSGWKPSRLA